MLFFLFVCLFFIYLFIFLTNLSNMSIAPYTSIVQWNCNGFYKHIEEVKLLVSRYEPRSLCFQETHFRSGQVVDLRGYGVYRKDSV